MHGPEGRVAGWSGEFDPERHGRLPVRRRAAAAEPRSNRSGDLQLGEDLPSLKNTRLSARPWRHCDSARAPSLPPLALLSQPRYDGLTARLTAMTTLRILLAGCLAGITATAAPNSAPATFYKDVLPILQKNCQNCHRPGEIAPMSLLTYTDARPWAKAIKTAVVTEKMPPWFADPKFGHFANDRRLSQQDIETLVSWADNGAPEGDRKDAPPARTFQDGWNIKPDMIIEMPKDFHVAATGTINYQNILVKANFPTDRWVVAAEMRPGNPKVVHHGRVIVVPPGAAWMAKAVPGEAYEEGSEGMGGAKEGTDLLGKYNPGLGAQSFDVDGSAKFIPKGSDVVFNIHYTSVGTPQTDRSK